MPVLSPQVHSAITIEPMVRDDWPDVSSIYIEGIATGNATFETLQPTWEIWDRDHLPFGRMVARLGGAIAGWSALARRSRRTSFAGVAELSIYVAAWARKKHVGSELIQAAIRESEKFGVWTLQGSIIRGNEASLKLVETAGFRQVGYRERIGKINGQWKDTILVERRSKVVGID